MCAQGIKLSVPQNTTLFCTDVLQHLDKNTEAHNAANLSIFTWKVNYIEINGTYFQVNEHSLPGTYKQAPWMELIYKTASVCYCYLNLSSTLKHHILSCHPDS